ncbi:MAG TPA: hypothetical protein VGW78_00695 [Candidatus Babeliales bacterium]|nr:hypothetical protein [Candidatus Babeliales bacterium]
MKKLIMYTLCGLLLMQNTGASAISKKQLKRLAGMTVVTVVLGYLTYRCFASSRNCFSKSSELNAQADTLHNTLLPEAKEKYQNLLNTLIGQEDVWLKKHSNLDGFNQKTQTQLLRNELSDLKHKLHYNLSLSPEESSLRNSCANHGLGGFALSNVVSWLGGGTLIAIDNLYTQLYDAIFGQKQPQGLEENS